MSALGVSVCIGVEDAGLRIAGLPPPAFERLPGPRADAGRIHDALGPACRHRHLVPGGDRSRVLTAAAIKDAVTRACAEAMQAEPPAEVLYCYFAGHGVSVSSQGRQTPLLLTADVPLVLEDLIAAANRGPKLQYFFIDACRSAVYQGQAFATFVSPVTLELDPDRTVHVLYATSPGGRAAEVEGQGVFAEYLELALRGDGPTLTHSMLQGWILQFGNLCEFVHDRVTARMTALADPTAVQIPAWRPSHRSAERVVTFGPERGRCQVRVRVEGPGRDRLQVFVRNHLVASETTRVAPGENQLQLERGQYTVLSAVAPDAPPRPSDVSFPVWAEEGLIVVITVDDDGRIDVDAGLGAAGDATELRDGDRLDVWGAWRRQPRPAQQNARALAYVVGWDGRWRGLATVVGPGLVAVPRSIWHQYRALRLCGGHDAVPPPPRPTFGSKVHGPRREDRPIVVATSADVMLLRLRIHQAEPLQRVAHAPLAVGDRLYVLGLQAGGEGDAAVVRQFWATVTAIGGEHLEYEGVDPIPPGYQGAAIFDARSGALVGMHTEIAGARRRGVGTWAAVWRPAWWGG